MTIGEKVKQAREAKGMTQEELAHALGYKSRTSVNKIETGERVFLYLLYVKIYI